jgi:hypothetical protein
MVMESELAISETLTNWLIPLVMAFLSVTLKDLANRRVNLVIGGIFTLLSIIHLIICPLVHIFDNP